MKWLLLGLLVIPLVKAECELSLSVTPQIDNSFSLVFDTSINQPVEYWLEDAFGRIIVPKRITKNQHGELILKNTPYPENWYHVKARLLAKPCRNTWAESIIKVQLQPKSEKTHNYNSPKKKLFDIFPWLFITVSMILALTIILFR